MVQKLQKMYYTGPADNMETELTFYTGTGCESDNNKKLREHIIQVRVSPLPLASGTSQQQYKFRGVKGDLIH